MISIFIAIVVMLLIAIALLAIALRTSPHFSYGRFFALAFFIALTSLGLYSISGNKYDLDAWLTQGKNHYALMQQMQDLGGIDGMIAKVKDRLAENPDDAQGWMILGKLYQVKQDTTQANIAFSKAKMLQQSN
jgi:cytochrome c-type biogenesis protein CcmH